MSDNYDGQPDRIAHEEEFERDQNPNSILERSPSLLAEPEATIKDTFQPGSNIQPKEEQKVDVTVEHKESNKCEPETLPLQDNGQLSLSTTIDNDPIFGSNGGDNPQFSSDDCAEALDIDSSSSIEHSNQESASDSDSTSDSDSGSESNAEEGNEQVYDSEDETSPAGGPIRSKNEVLDEKAPDLPKDLVVDENTPVELIGEISACVERSVIIKAYASGEFRVLKENSILCLEDRTILGPLFEIFGKLETPFYRVKYNSVEEFEKFENLKGTKVYYLIPQSEFQYTEKIKAVKGTDASNWHDEEIPEEEQEFSDDEKERAFKQSKKKKKNKNKNKAIRDEDKSAEPSAKRKQNQVPNGYTNFTQLPVKNSLPQSVFANPPTQYQVPPTQTQTHPAFTMQNQAQFTNSVHPPQQSQLPVQSQHLLQQPFHPHFPSQNPNHLTTVPQNNVTSPTANIGMNPPYSQSLPHQSYHPSQPYGTTQIHSQNNQLLQSGMSFNTASMSESELKAQLQMQFQIMNQLASQLNQQQEQNSKYTTGQLPPYHQRQPPPPGNN